MLYEDQTRKLKLVKTEALFSYRPLSENVNIFRGEFPEKVLEKDKSTVYRRR